MRYKIEELQQDQKQYDNPLIMDCKLHDKLIFNFDTTNELPQENSVIRTECTSSSAFFYTPTHAQIDCSPKITLGNPLYDPIMRIYDDRMFLLFDSSFTETFGKYLYDIEGLHIYHTERGISISKHISTETALVLINQLFPDKGLCLDPEMDLQKIHEIFSQLDKPICVYLHPDTPVTSALAISSSMKCGGNLYLDPKVPIEISTAIAQTMVKDNTLWLHRKTPLSWAQWLSKHMSKKSRLGLPANAGSQLIAAVSEQANPGTYVTFDPNLSINRLITLAQSLPPQVILYLPKDISAENATAATVNLGKYVWLCLDAKIPLDIAKRLNRILGDNSQVFFLHHNYPIEDAFDVLKTSYSNLYITAETQIQHIPLLVSALPMGTALVIDTEFQPTTGRLIALSLPTRRAILLPSTTPLLLAKAIALAAKPYTYLIIENNMPPETIQQIMPILAINTCVVFYNLSLETLKTVTKLLGIRRGIRIDEQNTIEQARTIALVLPKEARMHISLRTLPATYKVAITSMRPGTVLSLHPLMPIDRLQEATKLLPPGCALYIDSRAPLDIVKTLITSLGGERRINFSFDISVETIEFVIRHLKGNIQLHLDPDTPISTRRFINHHKISGKIITTRTSAMLSDSSLFTKRRIEKPSESLQKKSKVGEDEDVLSNPKHPLNP